MGSISEEEGKLRDKFIETLQASTDLIFNIEYAIRDSYSLKTELGYIEDLLGVLKTIELLIKAREIILHVKKEWLQKHI